MDSLGLETIGIEVDETIPYSLIENYIFDIKGLGANKKLLLLMLRRYCGSANKPAFPSYTTLMKAIGVSKRNVISKNLDFFIWLHWLERINRFDPKTKEKLNNYYLLSLKNIRLVLDHFEKKDYNFKDIETYFEAEYKDIETRDLFMSKPCKYLE